MAHTYEWDSGLSSLNTAEFDRSICQLRKDSPTRLTDYLSSIVGLVTQLQEQPGITTREFDRRFRLIVATIAQNDISVLQLIANSLRNKSPEALNSIRTLLPADMRHVAIPQRSITQTATSVSSTEKQIISAAPEIREEPIQYSFSSEYRAVALIGTETEHVQNEGMLRGDELDPLRLTSIEDLWSLAPTGLCGFVVGGSIWRELNEVDQRRMIRRICEYSSFLFVRICLEGLSPANEEDF